jgi:hypothetical protein
MSEARATAERQRSQEIFEENRLYCEKWGRRPAREGPVGSVEDALRAIEDASFDGVLVRSQNLIHPEIWPL